MDGHFQGEREAKVRSNAPNDVVVDHLCANYTDENIPIQASA